MIYFNAFLGGIFNVLGNHKSFIVKSNNHDKKPVIMTVRVSYSRLALSCLS